MTDLYLILHKVRGEPAFDIAIRDPDFADRWVRPADDRRVFPVKTWELASLADIDDINANGCHTRPYYKDDVPDDWPDCAHRETWPDYDPKDVSNPTNVKAVDDLLASLGLKSNSAKGYLRR